MSTAPPFSLKVTAISLPLQIIDVDLWENKILCQINFCLHFYLQNGRKNDNIIKNKYNTTQRILMRHFNDRINETL